MRDRPSHLIPVMSAALGLLLGLAPVGGVRAQVQVIAPEPDVTDPASVPDRHQVKDGETLSSVAERFLGTGDAWPKLWSYNPEITNPHWIYPGLSLKLKSASSGPASAEAGAPPTKSDTRTGLLRFAARRKQNVGSATVVVGEQVYLDRDALQQAARIVGSVEDHFMVSPTDEVYLKFNDGSEPTVGKEVIVFIRHHRSEVEAKAGRKATSLSNEPGQVVRVLGALRISSYDSERHIARAVVTEALEPIERGFEVADMPRRLAAVASKTNGHDVKARIVAASRPLNTLGNDQVVFIDAGQKQGVEVGNRFVIVRQGDGWRSGLWVPEKNTGELRPDPHPPKDSELPPEIVGELRVLYVRAESATALITSSSIELSAGERVEMRAGY